MKTKHVGIAIANFSGILILIGLLAAPFYFATQVSKLANVAGAKISKPYLIISQIDKFPGLQFSQKGENYEVTFSKIAQSQAFTGIALITNPTGVNKTYRLITTGNSQVFFGDDIKNLVTTISLPSSGSVPISIFSKEESSNPHTVEFYIITN